MRVLEDEKTGRDKISIPRELYDASINNGATVDGETCDVENGDGKIYTSATLYSAGSGTDMVVTAEDAEKYNIPPKGWQPDLRNASRVGQFLIFDLTHKFGEDGGESGKGKWVDENEAVTLRYTADKIIRAMNRGACDSKERRLSIIRDFESGLIALHFLSFAVKGIRGFGVASLARNRRGDFEITLAPLFIKILIKTRPSCYYPELLDLSERDEFANKIAAIIIEATQNDAASGAIKVKNIFTRLDIDLDALDNDRKWDQKRRLTGALDKLTKIRILKDWCYTVKDDETGKAIKISKNSIKPKAWVKAMVRWRIKGMEENHYDG